MSTDSAVPDGQPAAMPDPDAKTLLRARATYVASAARAFDILATPYRHPELDSSDMVVAAADDEPITKAGQIFRMRMSWVGPEGARAYETDNHVTVFEPNHAIAWAPGPVGGEPLGWVWRWDLAVKGKRDQKVRLTLTYDWSGASEEMRERYGVPLLDEAGLLRSVERLGALVTG